MGMTYAIISPFANVNSDMSFGILLILAVLVKDWTISYLLLTFLGMELYWKILPETFHGLPSLHFLIPALVATLPIYFVRRSELSWLRWGKIDRLSAIMILGTSIVSAIALILWAFWTDNIGIGQKMVQSVANVPMPILIFAGVPLFALINAISEEIVYRGILQEVLTKKIRSQYFILALQALAFAAVHYHSGFPNGKIGYAMVAVYGVALGYLRQRTQGMLAPLLAHICADLTIGYFLIFYFLEF